ncbi:MAG TPA: phage holin family protein [Allosphingosinicella sp.]|nr:phage holin family protein [Allosphingosinicella sp.]
MDAPADDPREESIGDLFGRLIEDGKSYAEAELELIRTIAEYRALRARRALVSLAVGWFLLVTSTTAVVMGAVLSLGNRIDPIWAGLLVGIPLAAGGYGLVSYGWSGIKGLVRDKAEQQAIDKGAAS